MELTATLYFHHPQADIVDDFNALLNGLSLSADNALSFLQRYQSDVSLEELAETLLDLEFESVEDYADNWLRAELLLSNGDEAQLLPWLSLFQQALPELDMRFAGQGEPDYFVFIRQQDGQPELLHCEEEEIEELFSYQDWFNEGLPEQLQLNYL